MMKMDEKNPNLNKEYHTSIVEDEQDNSGVAHWQNLIHQSRNNTVEEKKAREKRLTSDQFL